MLKPDKTNNETLESRMAGDAKKSKSVSIVVIATLLLIGLIVGGWFTFDEWRESVEALPAAIKVAACAFALSVTTAVTMASSSRRCCGDCWLKKIYHGFKRRLTSRTETPWQKR